MMMARKLRTRGIDNVLVDLSFDDAEELSVKAMLAMKLNALLEAQGLTQTRASKILGMPQPKISAIRNYKLRGISLERLMQALTVWRPAPLSQPDGDVGRIGRFRHCKSRADAASRLSINTRRRRCRIWLPKSWMGTPRAPASHLLQSK